MKKLLLSICAILALTTTSCESNGPRGKIDIQDESTDEMVNDVLDGDGWIYYYDVELHYKQNEEWESAGMYSMFVNTSDNDDGCSYWVDFSGFKSPAKKCSNYGYSYKVQYQGVWFYF